MSDLITLFESCNTEAEKTSASEKIIKLFKEGKIKSSDLSILDIAEATLGKNGMNAMRNADEDMVFATVKEATSPVSLRSFTNITQLLVQEGVVTAYTAPEFIGSQLVTEETSREDNVQIPGLKPIDDDMLVVPEGEEFPSVKFGEDYISTPKSQKRGGKIGVTREMIFFDRTGQVNELASSLGNRLGTNKEKRILRVVLGLDNSFSRNGTARNTYVASADPRINKIASNALVDWTDLDAVNNLFLGMTDDRTVGEPIQVTPDTLLVSPFKMWTARQIINATEIRNTTGSTIQTLSANPVSGAVKNVLTSQWLDWLLVKEGGVSAANAKDYWHFGQPKKAFAYRTLFPLTVRQAQNDQEEFERDVMLRYRADERGVAYIKAPWYMVQSYNA
jgi:hypothetical protein